MELPSLTKRILTFHDVMDKLQGRIKVSNPFSTDGSFDDRLAALFSEKDSELLLAIDKLARKHNDLDINYYISVNAGKALTDRILGLNDLFYLVDEINKLDGPSKAYSFSRINEITPRIVVSMSYAHLFALNGNIDSYKKEDLAEKYMDTDCRLIDEVHDCMYCKAEQFCRDAESLIWEHHSKI